MSPVSPIRFTYLANTLQRSSSILRATPLQWQQGTCRVQCSIVRYIAGSFVGPAQS
jgi:hypothetical protein